MSENESNGDEIDFGDFVILTHLIKKQKEIGHGTMNELMHKASEYFSGLGSIKCNIPYSRWNMNGDPNEEVVSKSVPIELGVELGVLRSHLTDVEPDTTKIQMAQKDGFSVGGAD